MGPSRPAFGSEARVPKRSALPCAFCYTSALTPHLKGTVVQGHRKESRLVSNVAQTDGCSSPENCCYLSVAIKNRLDPILNGLVWNGNRLPQILLAPVNWRVPDLRFANYKIVERTAREELFLVLVFVVWLLQVAPCSTALAPSRDRALSELQHTSWTAREGVPGSIQALAQTSDGYLWVGTANGLCRFDGVNVEPFGPSSGGRFPGHIVESLLAMPDGGPPYWLSKRWCSFPEK